MLDTGCCIFSIAVGWVEERNSTDNAVSASRLKKNEKAIWQRRFWEHFIRDEQDFTHHLEYIHYNPVKHGMTKISVFQLICA
jgi:REP element-mobilizing transposase RayT